MARTMGDTGISARVIEETWTLLKFDIVDLGSDVQPELLAAIEKEGRVLYEKVG